MKKPSESSENKTENGKADKNGEKTGSYQNGYCADCADL
jgi:hypothetical protein